jgi:CRISPR-associated protein Csm5
MSQAMAEYTSSEVWAEVETVTPLHIGSGRNFSEKLDLYYDEASKLYYYIDVDKLGQYLLQKQGEPGLSKLTNAIRQGTRLRTHFQGLPVTELAKRAIKLVINNPPVPENNANADIREQLHNSVRFPIMPGTSLKGAMRTAFMSSKIVNSPNVIVDLEEQIPALSGQNTKAGLRYEKRVFYNKAPKDEGPNHDLFRRVRPSDVTFDTQTQMRRIFIWSKKGNEFQRDEAKALWCECVPKKVRTFAVFSDFDRLRDAIAEHLAITNQHQHPLRSLSVAKLKTKELASVFNEYAKLAVKAELRMLSEELAVDDSHKYIEWLNDFNKRLVEVPENTFYIRVGFGGGWRQMTGDWPRRILTGVMFRNLANRLRLQGYEDMPFPKTRRLTTNGEPLGWLKITLLEGKPEGASLIPVRNQQDMPPNTTLTTSTPEPQSKVPVPYSGKLKQGVEIHCRMLSQEGSTAKLELLLEQGNQEVSITYRNLSEGYHIVTITNLDASKTKVLNVQYKKPL